MKSGACGDGTCGAGTKEKRLLQRSVKMKISVNEHDLFVVLLQIFFL